MVSEHGIHVVQGVKSTRWQSFDFLPLKRNLFFIAQTKRSIGMNSKRNVQKVNVLRLID